MAGVRKSSLSLRGCVYSMQLAQLGNMPTRHEHEYKHGVALNGFAACDTCSDEVAIFCCLDKPTRVAKMREGIQRMATRRFPRRRWQRHQ
jgi:hypothetical protein